MYMQLFILYIHFIAYTILSKCCWQQKKKTHRMYCSVHIYNDNWFCSFYRERAHVQCHFLAMLALTACRTSWSTSLLTMASASTSSALVSVAWCILALVNLQLSFLMRLNLLYFLLADFYFKIFSKTAKMFLILLWLMAVLQFYAGY